VLSGTAKGIKDLSFPGLSSAKAESGSPLICGPGLESAFSLNHTALCDSIFWILPGFLTLIPIS
jgi:hypothetical protein